MAAAGRVLGIYELVENILLQLPRLQDVIKCQRVCRSWSEIIKTSKPLRQHLFLEISSESGATSSTQHIDHPGDWTVNPLLADFLGGDLDPIGCDVDPEDEFQICGSINIVPEDPLPAGSWREMYATNPPCRSIKVYTEGHCHFHLRRHEPWRLGDLVDEFRDTFKWLVEALEEDVYLHYDYEAHQVAVAVNPPSLCGHCGIWFTD